MRSEDLSREQEAKLGEKIGSVVGYLHRLIRRMDECHFPPDDKLRVLATAAYDKVHHLSVELHYMSCQVDVGRMPKKP